MRSRQWSILAVLALLNYIMLTSLFSMASEEVSLGALPTRTPWPTFTATFFPTLPSYPTPTSTRVIILPPTPYYRNSRLTHVVQPGESLPLIAQRYGVSTQMVLHLNGLMDPNGVQWGQTLIIPGLNEMLPTWTPLAPTDTPVPPPTNTPRPRPPTKTPTATVPAETPTPKTHQFTGEIVRWYANCGATGVHRPSKIFDMDGKPLNGLRVRIWYENTYEAFSLESGVGGDYGPGEYDIALRSGEAGKFKIAVWDWQTGANGYARVDSEVLELPFDYDWQECQPGRSGHQSVVINWHRHW